MLKLYYSLCLACIGSCLICIRFISEAFAVGTDTFSHPYILFVSVLSGAGLAWFSLIPLLKRWPFRCGGIVWIGLIAGLFFRIIFWNSTPIYENDWNRYLWDGLVVSEGHNPYKYSPEIIYDLAPNAPEDVQALKDLSTRHSNIATAVNYADLTTIYPPVTMGVFYVATKVKPVDLNALRGVYLFLELIGFWLLLRALKLYGRDPKWTVIYWLNPMLIYSVYNAAHMDVILVPVLLGALILIKTRPFLSSAVLGLAGAIKFWPLLLGPVLLRQYKNRPFVFLNGGVIMGLITLFLTAPMLFQIGDNSGLLAYATQWERSSFIYGYIEYTLGLFLGDASSFARVSVAFILAGFSFWLALTRNIENDYLPRVLMALTLALYFLSPTGYPWYVIWLLPFLPFFPLNGAAMLTVTVSLYYLRFAMDERGLYDLYSNIVVPIQFGLPLLIIAGETLFHSKRSEARP